MSSRSKGMKRVWEKCSICESWIVLQELSHHLSVYHGVSAGQETPKSSKQIKEHEMGYIRQNIVHAFTKEFSTKGNDLGKLPLSTVSEFVFLHQNTMSRCQISVGSWVIVWQNDCSNSKRFALLKAWPVSDTIPITCVMLNQQVRELLSCELNDPVHILKLKNGNYFPAEELELISQHNQSFYKNLEFLNYIRYFYEEKIVMKGSNISINYLGQDCFFLVKEIYYNCNVVNNLDNNQISRMKDSSQEIDVSKAFEKLDIGTVSNSVNTTPKRNSPNFQICYCEKSLPQLASEIFYIHSKTRIKILINNEQSSDVNKARKVVTFDDIGGLDDKINEIRQILYLTTEDNISFSKFGLSPPKGIVLFGPSGTGKSLIAEAIRNTVKHTFITVNSSELFSKFYGETEAKLRAAFEDAKHRAPSIIFIDNMDTLCFKRTGSSNKQEHRVLSTLLSLLDDLPTSPDKRVVFLSITNNLDALDPAIRRPGRLDKEIEIGIPTEKGRAQIITKLLKYVNHNVLVEEVNMLSKQLHGYVGADIAALCAQAGILGLKRSKQEHSDVELVTCQDLVMASKLIKPSAMREILIEVPTVRWSDIGGQDDLKQKLQQSIEWPLKYPEVFERMGITPPKGMLMYGPPGCSKTLIAKALATESKLNFIAIKGPELFNKWVGESERAVREVFRKARSVSPSIVFFDEIDALAANRGGSSGGSNVGDRVLAQVLTEMDGLQQLKGVTIVAATNRPDMIDKALLRPGRLDRIVYVPLPDAKTRSGIFEIQFQRIPIAEDVSIQSLTDKTSGYSGAEVVAVCREAALKAMQESFDAQQVKAVHFDLALQIVLPRTSKDMITFYENYCLKNGSNSNLEA